jgi:hypothetical protein
LVSVCLSLYKLSAQYVKRWCKNDSFCGIDESS